jgi:hypothetical protein
VAIFSVGQSAHTSKKDHSVFGKYTKRVGGVGWGNGGGRFLYICKRDLPMSYFF